MLVCIAVKPAPKMDRDRIAIIFFLTALVLTMYFSVVGMVIGFMITIPENYILQVFIITTASVVTLLVLLAIWIIDYEASTW